MSAHDEGSGRQSRFGQLFIAMLGGAAVGAVAAYLTAPRSGADSRRRLQDVADDTRETVHRVPIALRRATEAARDAFNEALKDDSDVRAA
jgi:gas vesicle protein